MRTADRDTVVPVRLRNALATVFDHRSSAIHRADAAVHLRRLHPARALRQGPRGGLRCDLGGADSVRGRRRAPFPQIPNARGYCLAREMYSPVRVSMRRTSPSLMKSGTLTT